MKILHCCLAAFYIDGFGYQENILPKIHKLQGHDVKILASTENYIDKTKFGYVLPGQYINENGISVTRLPYVKWLPHFIGKKLRIYSGITRYLDDFKPDLIYLHNFQFISITNIAVYAKKNKVKIVADSHTDFVNSGKSWVSEYILHKLIYKWCAKTIEKYTYKFFGTLPLRSKFLEEVYGIEKNKIELLPFGADDTLFDINDKDKIKQEIRQQFNISDQDLVIITGGKIDARKNITALMQAFLSLQNEFKYNNVKLLVFGKPVDALKEEIAKLAAHPDIIYINWINSEVIYKYLLAADLGFFPGTHSVLWEQSVGLGLPCVFYKWEGITHVDVGGNCLFINNANVSNIKDVLRQLIDDKDRYQKMKLLAQTLGPQKFGYTKIATQAIN